MNSSSYLLNPEIRRHNLVLQVLKIERENAFQIASFIQNFDNKRGQLNFETLKGFLVLFFKIQLYQKCHKNVVHIVWNFDIAVASPSILYPDSSRGILWLPQGDQMAISFFTIIKAKATDFNSWNIHEMSSLSLVAEKKITFWGRISSFEITVSN